MLTILSIHLICFTTPDLLTNCILEYLKYRKRCGEKLNDKSPLIRDDFIIDDLLHIENPRTLALISYVMHLRNILIKTRLIIITPITISDTLEKTKKKRCQQIMAAGSSRIKL
jgi:hypothetical protein